MAAPSPSVSAAAVSPSVAAEAPSSVHGGAGRRVERAPSLPAGPVLPPEVLLERAAWVDVPHDLDEVPLSEIHRIGLVDDTGRVHKVDAATFQTRLTARYEAIRRNGRRLLTATWWVWLDADGKPGWPQ